MRVSDAEREAAAAELQEHFASGRLNQEELDERLAAAFDAKTRGDLGALFADLPSSGRSSGPNGPGDQPGWRADGGARGAPVGSGIGGVVVAMVMLWVLFIGGILGLFGLGAGRPLGIVLIVAAFALLRRLLFMIFGRRRMRGRGPRRGPRRRRF